MTAHQLGTLGDNIKFFREQKGWSQEMLADWIGVTRSSVSQWEKGKIRPRMGALEMLAMAFNIPVSLLLGESIGEGITSIEDAKEMQLLEAFRKLDPNMQEAAIAAVRGMAGM